MALTVAVTEKTVMGNKRVHRGTIAFDASYPTGGESFTVANMQLKVLDEVEIQQQEGYQIQYDYTNSLVLVYAQGVTTGSTTAADSTSGTFAEDTAAAETAAVVMGVAVDTTIDLGPMKQMTSTADLSGVTGVRWVATGH